MMRQVARAPELLRKTEQETQINGNRRIDCARSEEGRVNKIVGDGVGIPPKTQGNEPNRRHPQEEEAVPERQAKEE